MKKRCIILIMAAMLLSSGCNTQTSNDSPVTDGVMSAKDVLYDSDAEAQPITTTEEITETTEAVEEINDFTDDDFIYYEVLSDNNELEGYGISGWNENKKLPSNLTIPAEHAGKPVVQITASFKGNLTVKNVTLPDTIAEINTPLFEFCYSVETVSLPDGLSSLCDRLFYRCSNLKSVVMPDNLVEINDSVFLGCENLAYIDLPDSIEKIGDSAFCGCESLTEITLPQKLESLSNCVFCLCENLKQFTWNDNIKYIEKGAFAGCKSLGEITIPDTVIKLDKDAFGVYDMELTVNYNGKQYEWYDIYYCDALRYN